MTATGAISLSHAPNLDWDLPLPSSVQVSGYTQQVTNVTFAFHTANGQSVPPDSQQNVTMDGGQWRDFHWNAPPDNSTVSVVETITLAVKSDLSPFSSTATYPLSDTPSDVQPYIQQTTFTNLADSISSLVRTLKNASGTEKGVVEAATDWVATNIQYTNQGQTDSTVTAQAVLQSRQTSCGGYGDVLAGLLRALGIPVRTETGWVMSQPIAVSGTGVAASSVQWSEPATAGEPHTWLDIWFPDAGWTAFDPQSEKFFVDPGHLAFYTGVDARYPHWENVAADGNSWWGPALSNGDIQVVPALGSGSQVTVQAQDDFHASVTGIRNDVSTIVMYAR